MRLITEQVCGLVSASGLLDNGFSPTGFQRRPGPTKNNVDSARPAGRRLFRAMGNMAVTNSSRAAKVVIALGVGAGAGRRVLAHLSGCRMFARALGLKAARGLPFLGNCCGLSVGQAQRPESLSSASLQCPLWPREKAMTPAEPSNAEWSTNLRLPAAPIADRQAHPQAAAAARIQRSGCRRGQWLRETTGGNQSHLSRPTPCFFRINRCKTSDCPCKYPD